MSNADTSRIKRRRFFRSLLSQSAIVAPALILVIAGFVFAYQFVGPAPLDRIERSVEMVSLPAGFAASAYTLRLHIDFLRRRVGGHPRQR